MIQINNYTGIVSGRLKISLKLWASTAPKTFTFISFELCFFFEFSQDLHRFIRFAIGKFGTTHSLYPRKKKQNTHLSLNHRKFKPDWNINFSQVHFVLLRTKLIKLHLFLKNLHFMKILPASRKSVFFMISFCELFLNYKSNFVTDLSTVVKCILWLNSCWKLI